MKEIDRSIFVAVCLMSIIFIECITNNQLQSNKGKQFIIGFMQNHKVTNVRLRLSITTQVENEVNVNITTPIFDPAFYTQFVIRKGQVKELTLNRALQGTFGVENKGIYIEADDDVTVYGSNFYPSTIDEFLVLPISVLGNEYYVMSWSGSKPSFIVVANEDYTNLNITLGRSSQSVSLNGSTIDPGQSISVNLRKFETFYVQTPGGDLTGTHIHGNTPFAVFGGNACGNVEQGFCDHLAEQMVPVDKWGKEFVTISMPGCESEDWFKIVAGLDNTTVTILGLSAHTLAKSGDFYRFNSSLTSVSSDKPISLFMFSSGVCGTNFSGDPSMVMIPPLSQYSSNLTFFTTLQDTIIFENYVGIVIDVTFIEGLRLDGLMLLASDWSSVYGSSSQVYTEFTLSTGVHSIYHIDSSVKFMAIAAGIQRNIAYSYLLGIDFFTKSCKDGSIGN